VAKKSRRHRAKGRWRKPTPKPAQPSPAPVAKATRVELLSEKQAEPRLGEMAGRDYSYVLSDLKRTLIITGVLLALLIILAILW